MLLGFHSQFVPKILVRTKIHSLRDDYHNRWKPGIIIHMATGMRTKNYKQFDLASCISTQHVRLKWVTGMLYVYVDDRCFDSKEIIIFCVNDGFEGVKDFTEWFNPNNLDVLLCKKMIHWTDKRY